MRTELVTIRTDTLPLDGAFYEPAGGATAGGVLPLGADGEGWPKLLGRVLFAFFGGKEAAIGRLQLAAIYDQIPDDILETWTTALWACQACLAAATSDRKLRHLVPNFASLRRQVYRATSLTQDALNIPQITAVLDSLSGRFAARLGLDPERIRGEHSRTVAELHKAPGVC
jgi:hypothetical protein